MEFVLRQSGEWGSNVTKFWVTKYNFDILFYKKIKLDKEIMRKGVFKVEFN